MATTSDIKKALDELNSGGKFSFPNKDLIKEEVLKMKMKLGYTVKDPSTGEETCLIDEETLNSEAKRIIDEGKGEIVNKIDSDLASIENSISSVMSQAPALFTQLATIPAAMIQVSPVGPTMPNPLDIKNSFGQIKAQANSLSSLLSGALSKVVDLGLAELPIPGLSAIFDPVLAIVKVIAKIKNFGG